MPTPLLLLFSTPTAYSEQDNIHGRPTLKLLIVDVTFLDEASEAYLRDFVHVLQHQ